MYVQVDAARARRVAPVLAQVPGVTRVALSRHARAAPSATRSRARTGRDVRRDLARAVVTSGWGLLELRPMRMSLEEIFLQLDDRGTAGQRRRERQCVTSSRSRDKELRAYFASPIAYIVIGCFALLFGWFYVSLLNFFVQQSMQAGADGRGQPVNINQQLIRPLLQNAAVIILFVLPMITMRTYSEEKRSGTIELLLTSPLTDLADHPRQVPRRAGALRRDARASR